MRVAALLILLLPGITLPGQVLINEVQTAPGSVLAGASGDPVGWVELYNGGRRAATLDGMRVVMAGRQHHLRTPLQLPPGGHLLLRCDPQADRDPHTIPFALPPAGGTILLVAADGASILDIFTYAPMPPGSSMGRLPDGATAWSRFATPTPGETAPAMEPVQHIAARPRIHRQDHGSGSCTVMLEAEPGASIWYTVDGSLPDPGASMSYAGPIAVEAPAVLVACSTLPHSLPSPPAALPVLERHADGIPALSINLDPALLWGDSAGIDTEGDHANHSRKGRDWEREALLQVVVGDSVSTPMAVGLRVAGSGSRSKPKRSFKVLVRDRFGSMADAIPLPDGSLQDEYMLRADATRHALLRNQLMEQVAIAAGNHVDVQPALPVHLHLNGSYRGLYRALHPKDADRITQWAGGLDVDVLEGPAFRVVSGDDQHFTRALERLLGGAPQAELEELFELESLLDLAAFDLYTGRVDHDLNVRCWRPRVPGGRWRWVLYDMDLWPPVEENALERMCSTVAPEAPFVQQLLGHTELGPLFVARTTALLATLLHPEHAAALLDSLYQAQQVAMEADHQRWHAEMDVPTPAETRRHLGRFVGERPGRVLEQLAGRLGSTARNVEAQVEPRGGGTLLVEGLTWTDHRATARFFPGIPLRMEAVPAPGMRFAGWRDDPHGAARRMVDPAQVQRLRAVFVPDVASGGDHLQ